MSTATRGKRQPGPFTQAVRTLYEETNGEISYKDARPILAKRFNLTLVEEPPEKSDLFKQFEKLVNQTEKPDWDNADAVEAFYKGIGEEMGLSLGDYKKVVHEAKLTRAFDLEENRYNTTKSNYKKFLASKKSSQSRKPGSGGDARTRAAAATGRTAVGAAPISIPPKHEPPTVRPSDASAENGQPQHGDATVTLQLLAQYGSIEGLRAEFAKLERQVQAARESLQVEERHLTRMRTAVEMFTQFSQKAAGA